MRLLIEDKKNLITFKQVKYSLAELKDFVNKIKSKASFYSEIEYITINERENKLILYYKVYNNNLEDIISDIIPNDSFYFEMGPYDIPS